MSLSGYTFVFDLDGTLVDSAPDLVGALNYALAQENLLPVDLPLLRRLVGHGAKALIERALELYAVSNDSVTVERMLANFLSYYADHIADKSTPYSNVVSTLEYLVQHGAVCAVCTNKPTALANALIKQLDLTHFFKAVCGGDYFMNRKPHPDHILKTIEEVSGESARAIMVGDSITDRDAARASKVPVILVDYGYTDIPAAELEANYTIADFQEIIAIVQKF